ncbi:hypothetical protein [Candidatus Uabimicrobium sp. HlEnr_7]|uniref:hypothetical protein n=1 Tax=Candidatus Uabimicrobium helgolandensis TaxID=3095367 RepID=UPI003556CBEE
MRIKLILLYAFACIFITGCHKPFMEVGGGYARFNLDDDIVSVQNIDGENVETKVNGIDSFIVKVRTGGSIIEALPEFRTGIEFRGALGGDIDVEEAANGDEAFSDFVLLMLGGGPFVSWKQPLGDVLFVEAGAFASGHTAGVHESGQEVNDDDIINEEDTKAIGWSAGVFAKVGILPSGDFPVGFALEASYEKGEWLFEDDINGEDKFSVDGYSVLLSSEIEF